MTIAALVASCVGLVGMAVAGRSPASPDLQFIQIGHWVYSSEFQSAFHVDGSTVGSTPGHGARCRAG